MPQLVDTPDPINDYERAVCYYSIPRVVHPLTTALIAVFAICLIEALAAIAVGLWIEHDLTLRIGAWALAGLIVLGIVGFTWRALSDEVRRRRALAEAHVTYRSLPQAIPDLPDPFASHILLCYPADRDHTLFACSEVNGDIRHFVERTDDHLWWKVRSAQDEEVCRVRALHGVQSFAFGRNTPSVLGVYKDEKQIATIRRRFSWVQPFTEIEPEASGEKPVVVRNQGLYREERLIGRIYFFRDYAYLDIERAHAGPAILAYFVTLV